MGSKLVQWTNLAFGIDSTELPLRSTIAGISYKREERNEFTVSCTALRAQVAPQDAPEGARLLRGSALARGR